MLGLFENDVELNRDTERFKIMLQLRGSPQTFFQ